MKYLFLLLVLTACTAPTTSAGTAATDTAAQTDLRPLSEKDHKLFINNGNPYLKEYQEFFAGQLKRYGTNTKGEPLVNFEELKTFIFSNSFSFLGIADFIEEAFTANWPAWTTNAGVVGETQDSCTVGFSAEFFPQTQILSQEILTQYMNYCMDSSPTYALAFALFEEWHISNIIRLAEMGADVTNMTNKYGYVWHPYTYLYGRELSLFKYFHEERKVPLPDDALWMAFGAERQDLFNYFLEQGANVNWQSPNSNGSILHVFLSDEQWPMAEILLQRGLDPNITNMRGVTAFVHLLSINKLSTAKILLEYTDANILPPGQTNLMEAALWARRTFYKSNNLYGAGEGLSPEVIQFISNLSSGK